MDHLALSRLILIGCMLGFLLPGLPQPARAEPPPAETVLATIDAFIAERMDELAIPGLALAVVRGGEVLAARGYGRADSSGRPVTPQTPFLVASLSKPITALGVMQLVEAGQLELDAPVQASLPWFRTADPAASAQITVRHLLHHASGLSELEGDLRNLETDRGPQALEASLRRLSGSKLNAAPGERFEYSNTNYDILGLLIQTASGRPYGTYIQEEIFAPLSMQHAHTSLEEARLDGLASGHTAFFGLTLPYDRRMPYSHTVTPSAGLFASADDLARFLIVQLNRGRTPDGAQLLSPAGMAALHSPGMQIGENVHYAMGWTQFRFDQLAPAGGPGAPAPLALAHGGDWENYKALMLLVPEHELGLAVLINKYDLGRNSAYEQIAWNTALLALDLPAADFPANEDFMTRYGRIVGGALVLLLIASLVWSVRRLRADTGWDPQDPQRRRQILIFLVILPLVDLAIAGYVLLIDFSQFPAALLLDLAFIPAAGLLYLLVLGLTLGWGTLRTALAIRRLFIARKMTAPAF
jgi:CubicO group peptidase (beta-lactamase class C family)